MQRDAVTAEVKAIFHKVAPDIDFDALDLSKPLRDQVEMDSLDFFNVLVAIHKKLGVNVPDSVLLELNHLNDLIDYIVRNAA